MLLLTYGLCLGIMLYFYICVEVICIVCPTYGGPKTRESIHLIIHEN